MPKPKKASSRANRAALLKHLGEWCDPWQWDLAWEDIDARQRHEGNAAAVKDTDARLYRQERHFAEDCRQRANVSAFHLRRTSDLLAKVEPDLIDQLPIVEFSENGTRPDSTKLAAAVRKLIALVEANGEPAAVTATKETKEPGKRGRKPPTEASVKNDETIFNHWVKHQDLTKLRMDLSVPEAEARKAINRHRKRPKSKTTPARRKNSAASKQQ